MAKALSQVNMEKSVEENQGAQVSDDDVELAFRMTVEMLDEGGMQVIRDAIDKSNDPAMVIGQFLAQIMGQLAEQLRDEYEIDPKIFLAKNGWLDAVLDFIETDLGYPDSFSDEVYQQVLEIVKAAATTPDAPNNVTDPEAGNSRGAPLPQQAAMPGQGIAAMASAPSAGGMP